MIELEAPEDLYDIATLLRDPERYVVESVWSRATGEQAVAVTTSRLHNIAGKYTGKDDPVMLVRVQMNFPATGEVLAPFALGHFVAGGMRGSHHVPLMPVPIGTATSWFDGCIGPRPASAGNSPSFGGDGPRVPRGAGHTCARSPRTSRSVARCRHGWATIDGSGPGWAREEARAGGHRAAPSPGVIAIPRSRGGRLLVVECEGHVVGFVLVRRRGRSGVQRGQLETAVANTIAIAFYEHLGYRKVAHLIGYYGRGMHASRMEKALDGSPLVPAP